MSFKNPVSIAASTAMTTAMIIAALFTAGTAYAATMRVDDSGTTLSQGVVPMRWRQLVPGRAADNSVQASVRVQLRLNLARWLNQPVRLYMALAPASGEPVYAEWRTQGRLLAGSVRSGARALLYDGLAGTPTLEETLDLTLRTDGRALVSTQTLQFYFEIDTP